jgi:hypothetical protein
MLLKVAVVMVEAGMMEMAVVKAIAATIYLSEI